MAQRPCPLCGKSIAIDAYYCKHCKRNLPTEAGGKAVGATEAARADAAAVKPWEWYCLQCDQFGGPLTVTKGSFFIEVVLWLFLIVPGLVYSIWRLTSKFKACPHCGSPTIVPQSSPRAQAALRKLS